MNYTEKIKSTNDKFIEIFNNSKNTIVVRAPGRVNLIGEHTDYNDGFVFPIAIDYNIFMTTRIRNDSVVKTYSIDYQESDSFDLNNSIVYNPDKTWSNYIRGVFHELQKSNIKLQGMEIVFQGDIPQGGGLSSSAALETATILSINHLNKLNLKKIEMIKLSQRAENNFVGMNCGIMDQFISLSGKKNCALFLDCRFLEYKHIPLNLKDHCFTICQSGIKHKLVESEYNKRRQECEEGVKIIAQHHNSVHSLRDIDINLLNKYKTGLSPIIYKRCRHVITEIQRVPDSITALNDNNLEKFGQLMTESHKSLRDDYEVSCREIDLLVDLALQVPGVLGSRITGGGFGGCTVSLMKKENLPDFRKSVISGYKKLTGIQAQILESTPAHGAEVLNTAIF